MQRFFVCAMEGGNPSRVLATFETAEQMQGFIAALDRPEDQQIAVVVGEIVNVEVDRTPRVLIHWASPRRGRPKKKAA